MTEHALIDAGTVCGIDIGYSPSIRDVPGQMVILLPKEDQSRQLCGNDHPVLCETDDFLAYAFRPDEARELAQLLLRAADLTEEVVG